MVIKGTLFFNQEDKIFLNLNVADSVVWHILIYVPAICTT